MPKVTFEIEKSTKKKLKSISDKACKKFDLSPYDTAGNGKYASISSVARFALDNVNYDDFIKFLEKKVIPN